MITSIDRTPMIREKFLIVAGTSNSYLVAPAQRGWIALADTGYPGLLKVSALEARPPQPKMGLAT